MDLTQLFAIYLSEFAFAVRTSDWLIIVVEEDFPARCQDDHGSRWHTFDLHDALHLLFLVFSFFAHHWHTSLYSLHISICGDGGRAAPPAGLPPVSTACHEVQGRASRCASTPWRVPGARSGAAREFRVDSACGFWVRRGRGGGAGSIARLKLKRIGDVPAPCGKPVLTFLADEVESQNLTLNCLPWSQRFTDSGREDFKSFNSFLCEIMSNFLLWSICSNTVLLAGFFLLKPCEIFCLNCLRWSIIKCFVRKPCW